MKRLARAMILVLLLPAQASAAEVGRITAMVDGNRHDWVLINETGSPRNAARVVMNGLDDILLWGAVSAADPGTPVGALRLHFSLITIGQTPKAADATLQYLQNGDKSGYLAVEDGLTHITVTRAETQADGLHLAGTFTARAGFSEQINLRLTDKLRTIQIDGSFEAVLPTE
ncbi:MAG: hypothetical protein AB7E21_02695 [Pseudodonghicola sp.]